MTIMVNTTVTLSCDHCDFELSESSDSDSMSDVYRAEVLAERCMDSDHVYRSDDGECLCSECYAEDESNNDSVDAQVKFEF